MNSIYAVVLAAGQGTRMKSRLPKVLHPVAGKAMVDHVLDTLETLGIKEIYLIVGHEADLIRSHVGDRVHILLQEKQLGTGHAVLQAEPHLAEKEGTTIVICGDTPLLTPETIAKMLDTHQKSKAAATLLTTIEPDPTGYGRIVRKEDQSVLKIVEHKDANDEERKIQEINAGTYCFDNHKLFNSLKKVTNNNSQGEYYLTDCIQILRNDGEQVEAYQTPDREETIGINDRSALARAEAILRRRINLKHMQNGVTIQNPEHTYIDQSVTIGRDTVILAGVHLRGTTTIGEGCTIGPDTEITDSIIGDGVTITRSVIINSQVDQESSIGPFAYLRPNSKIGKDVRIGDFVEVKNSTIGDGSKVAHLSYIGDADIGKKVNMSCGSITVNYDGFRKHRTTVEDGAFVGCNVNLISPVRIGKNAYIAAGSTIHQDVPENAMAIARERQTNKENYVDKIKAKRNKNQ